MNKTIKKIVALSMGTSMLFGAGAGVALADLGDYPSPFVKDGAFVGKIVIGAKANSVDVLGAMDIAASLQRAASSPVSGSGSGSTAVAVDGFNIEGNDPLLLEWNLADTGISVIDDADLSELLASGTVESDSGDFDYDVEVRLTNTDAEVAADVNAELQDLGLEDPVVYFDLDGATVFYEVVIDFDDTWDAEDFIESESIELFGTEFTFDQDNENDGDVLTLYGSENTLLVAKGETKTVTYNGEEYTIEVLGGNSDGGTSGTAFLSINGASKTVSEGDSVTLPSGGLPVYVKEVFYDTTTATSTTGDEVSVELFIGSNKLELDLDGTVTKNAVELDEVTVDFGGILTFEDIDTITFTVNPQDADDEVTQIMPGESYTDPVFGAFKFQFVGSEDLMAGKTPVEFTRSGDAYSITFTPRGGKATTVEMGNDDTTGEDLWTGATLGNLTEDSIFFWNEGSGDNVETHVLQIDSIRHGNNTLDDNYEVVIKDLSHSDTYNAQGTQSQAGYANNIIDELDLYIIAGGIETTISLNTVQAAGAATYDFLTAGTDIETADGSTITIATYDGSNDQYNITEDNSDADAEGSAGNEDIISVNADWDGTESEYDFSSSLASYTTELGDNDDVNYYLTQFGTFVTEDSDESSWVKVYLPSMEVGYDMFLLPVDSEVVVSGSTGGAVALNAIAVGMAILDSDADLGSRPYIIVGGPCANTIAMEALGNPADCAAGFTEGKAMIKLFSSQNALLVAGYSAKDTQGASRVLANYMDYGFDGNELEVITTNLMDLDVKAVSN